jgi:DNA invertase Pin-like site-specific DNA recombinase
MTMPESNSTAGLRAGTYLRKSTDKQEQSIDRQRGQVATYAAARGYRVVQEYVDEGIAGDVFDRRPGFQKLLAAAARHEFDVILVDEPSRLSRQNVIELIEKVIAPLRRSGVKIDTVSKGPLDYESMAGIIMMTVHAHQSAEEPRELSRRTLGEMVKRALAGKWFGWLCPYGLRIVRDVDPATGKVTDRRCVFGPEEEVRAVRFLFDAVANRGWKPWRCCRELEARGVKPPAGNGYGRNKAEGRWNVPTVRNMLRNPKYVGDLPWNQTAKGKFSAWEAGTVKQNPSANVNRQVRRNAAADVIIIPDLIPPIIDRDTFARAQAALARGKGQTSPRAGASYLFTHLLVCGDCHGYLRGKQLRGRKGYVCGRYKEYGAKACSRNTVLEAQIKETIFAALKDDILSPARLDAVEAEMTRRLEAERSSGEADRIKKQLDAVDRDIAQGNANLARLPEDRLPGVIAQVRQWEAERGGPLARLHELEHGAHERSAVLAEARRQLWRLRDALDNGDEEAQATVLREVVSKVEVRFTHERTHGRWSPTGQGRLVNRPCGVTLYVRPGLGLSCLTSPGSR